ncbi:MAG: GNAT family N-acetyltransferase [Sediminicola sp.]
MPNKNLVAPITMEIKYITAPETWPLRHRVMWPDKPVEFVQLPEDQSGIHLGLHNGKGLVSVVSLFISGDSAQFRKLATERSEQGKGHATALLLKLFSIISEHPTVASLWCNARKDKMGFYERLGFAPTSLPFHKNGLEYVKMERHWHKNSTVSSEWRIK